MDIKTYKYNEKRFCLLGFILFGMGREERGRRRVHVLRDLEVKGVVWLMLEVPSSVMAQKEASRKSVSAEARESGDSGATGARDWDRRAS